MILCPLSEGQTKQIRGKGMYHLELMLNGKRIINYGRMNAYNVRRNIKNMIEFYNDNSPYYIRITC